MLGRKPGSLGRKMQSNGEAAMSLNSPTTAPTFNEKYGQGGQVHQSY